MDEETEAQENPWPIITYLAPSISLPSWAFDTPCWARVWGNLSGTCLPKFLLAVSEEKGVSLDTSSYTHMCHSNRTLALTLENQSVVCLWWSYFRVPIRFLTFHYTGFLLCPELDSTSEYPWQTQWPMFTRCCSGLLFLHRDDRKNTPLPTGNWLIVHMLLTLPIGKAKKFWWSGVKTLVG